VPITSGAAAVAVALAFTRLDVQGRDSLGLRVTCDLCPGGAAGVVAEADVVADPLPVAEAATRSPAEFALALRDAAAWGKVEELVPVMVEDFTFGFSAQRDRAAALTAWDWENFRTLDLLPRLLDSGIVEIEPGFWVAPLAYAQAPGYQGLRTGFRKNARTGRWEWLFLVQADP
jgi:hypothetical protein